MPVSILAEAFLKELKAESIASRKCLERIPETVYEYKPHEKSMQMGYLTLLVAEIPKWIRLMIEKSEIDFATYEHLPLSTNAALLAHFEENLQGAINALEHVSDEALARMFHLKNHGTVLFSSPTLENIGSTINHWVHHRGQLTVYMRMNNIDVPSIYGPSADDKGF